MPKAKRERTSRVLHYLNVGKGVFQIHPDGARCNACNVVLRSTSTDALERHLVTPKHKDSARRYIPQPTLQEMQMNQNLTEFEEDIVKTFLIADIPLHKLDNQYIKSLFEKYTTKKLPSVYKARTKYVPKLYADSFSEISAHLRHKKLWVSVYVPTIRPPCFSMYS